MNSGALPTDAGSSDQEVSERDLVNSVDTVLGSLHRMLESVVRLSALREYFAANSEFPVTFLA
ncbi:hypothetical protein FFI97_019455 [Variovorax sp. KBS0712]|nr:hypothetical protein FFI97_019455 [Variovorax sp. KBS0712]